MFTILNNPKDIVRSYAHEMIHHIQNLEGRLGNINTTNTMEDDHLNNLEAEANLKGTMTFRNWTDSLQESKKKDPFGLNAYAQELARLREIKYLNPNFDAEWKEAVRYPQLLNDGPWIGKKVRALFRQAASYHEKGSRIFCQLREGFQQSRHVFALVKPAEIEEITFGQAVLSKGLGLAVLVQNRLIDVVSGQIDDAHLLRGDTQQA